MSEEQVRQWRREGGSHRVIMQAELLPAMLAMTKWQNVIAESNVLLFIDNEAARMSLIGGASRNEASARIVNFFWEEVTRVGGRLWVERVSSEANPADGPSRGDWRWCKEYDVLEVSAPPL